MIAVVTSVGEPTTDLCVWSLERSGFDVQLIENDETTLWQKLKMIYEGIDEDFVRVDADVVPNKYLTEASLDNPPDVWWVQYQTFDWYRQTVGSGGIQYIKKEALPILRKRIAEFKDAQRPETQMFRVKELTNPRRCITVPKVMGVHGYGNYNLDMVKEQKRLRGQLENYDWELCERLNRILAKSE